jgi:hypothetical protein
MAAVASISRARGWAVSTAAPLRAGESRADSSRRGSATAEQRNPVCVKVAADGVVEHVVSRSHGDKVKPMGRMRRGVAGPMRRVDAEGARREQSVPRRAAIRSGRDAAAVGGADWQQADSRGPGRGYCAHGSVIPETLRAGAGARHPATVRIEMDHVCASVCSGTATRNVPLVARVV